MNFTAALLAGATFVLTLGVASAVAYLAEQTRLLAKQRHAGITAADHGSAVQQQIYHALSATYAIATIVRRDGGVTPDFTGVASALLPVYPAVSALQLAPGGVVRESVPLEGNEKAIGHDLLADPSSTWEAFLALETRQLTLAGPYELRQGGAAAVARLPVYLPGAEERFWGFATAVIRLRDLIRASRLKSLAEEGYHYELWRKQPETGRKQTFADSGGGPLESPVEYEFDVPNARWTLSVAPVGGWYSLPSLVPEGILGLLASLLAALIAYTAVRQPELLRRLVATRTRELEAEIAQRVRAQSALSESEDRLRTLVEATSDWVWEVDENGVYTYASPKVRDLLGYAPEELIGKTAFSLMPPEEARRVGAEFAAIAAEPRPFALLENVNLHRDGRRVVLETSGVPIFDAGGRFRGYRGIDRDITQRKAAEERIRKLSRAVEQSANAVIITDVEGTIEYVNPKFCEITGYALEEVLGRNPRLLKSGEHPRDMYEEMWLTLKGGHEWFGEFHNRKKNGELFWCLQAISAIRDERGVVTHFVSVTEDISSRKLAESTIRQLAYYDSLTGLPNRRLFRDRLERAEAAARRAEGSLALLYLDVDRLKNVNDTLGHDVGDALLKAVAGRIVDTVRSEDTVARLEGDEFAVLLAEARGTASVARVCRKLATALKLPFRALGHELYVTASIGVSVYPQDSSDLDELNRNADIALHRAKQVGDSFRFFTAGMDAAVGGYLRVENSLRKALERDEFTVYVQPQADLDTGNIAGAEALVRWRHPERGIVEPGHFIQLAEETGLIVPIGEWVLREACREAKAWHAIGRPARIAVNLSPRQFREKNLVRVVGDALADCGLPARWLELEITESMLMDHTEQAITTLRELVGMGLTIAVDDFGTGYSSLGYLKRLPIRILKIDGSFVQDLAVSPDSRAIVSAVVALAHELKLSVVAEGVETREQLDCLRALGCDKVQGYLLGRPMPAEDFRSLLRVGRLPGIGGPARASAASGP